MLEGCWISAGTFISSGVTSCGRPIWPFPVDRRTVELVQPRKKTAGTMEVKEVISAMQNSPTAGYLQELSLHERIMLAAVLKCVKKEGVEEVKWGDVSYSFNRVRMHAYSSLFMVQVQHQHVIYTSILTGDDDPTRKPTFAELNGVLDSLIASRAMLIEDGAAAQRKPAGERKVVLNLEQIEVERVLSEIGGQMWKNALGVS
jgi:origin recognition complex subunit 1